MERQPENVQPKPASSQDAVRLAEALKRMLSAETGELAERLDGSIRYPSLTADTAMFCVIFGCSIKRVMEELGIQAPPPPKPTPRSPGRRVKEAGGWRST